MAIVLNDNIKINAGKPSDYKYLNELNIPYSGTTEVISKLPPPLRYTGLTVNVGGVEYWFKNGISDPDLILKTTEGTGTGERIEKTFEQVSHGFSVGDIAEYSGSTFIPALAVFGRNSEVIGFVSEVPDPDSFTLVFSGYISGISGLTLSANTTYYLSSTVEGTLTSTEPLDPNTISKPVLTTLTNNDALVFQYRALVNTTGITETPETISASNGLTKLVDNIVLGGTLTGTTIIGDINTGGIILDNDGQFGSTNAPLLFYGDLYSIGYTGTSINTNVGAIDIGEWYSDLYIANDAGEANHSNIGDYNYFRAYIQTFYGTGNTSNITVQSNSGGTSTIKAYGNSPTFAGIEYFSDYSPNYTNRSLVDKEYVDTTLSTSGWLVSGTTILTDNVTIDSDVNYIDFTSTGSVGYSFQNTNIDGQGTLSIQSDSLGFSMYGPDFDKYASIGLSQSGSNAFVSMSAGEEINDYSIYFGIEPWNARIAVNGTTYPNFKGLVYNSDYSSNYTNRSLVDKGYVYSNYWNTTGTTNLLGNSVIQGNNLDIEMTAYSSGLSSPLSSLLLQNTSITLYSENANSDSARLLADNNVTRATASISAYNATEGEFIELIVKSDNVATLSSLIPDFAGLEYGGDYSANFTPYSLVNKGYVTGLTSNVNKLTINVTTSAITLTTNNHVVLVNATDSTTITLPASPVNGQTYIIKDASGNALSNNITISGNGNNIDGQSSAIINTNYGIFRLVYSSTIDSWYTI